MRRADVVLTVIPTLVFAGFLAERAAGALAATRNGPVEVLANVPLFVTALLGALALIYYEIATKRAVTA